jgi:diguanylate cyclase (GGDEF)-like protein
MNALIRSILSQPPDNVLPGEYSQSTLAQVIRCVEQLAASSERPFQIVYGWSSEHFPDLPLLPINRQLPSEYWHNVQSKLKLPEDFFFLFDDGQQCFSLVGHLVDRPGISVFQQKSSVKALWTFDPIVHARVLTRLDSSVTPLPDPPPDSMPIRSSFMPQLIKQFEQSHQETQQSLALITGIMQVQKAIARELDFERLLELIGDTLSRTFHFSLGELELYDSEEERLVHHVTWYADAPGGSLSKHLQILLNVEEERILFQSGTPTVLERIQEHPIVLNHALVTVLGLRFAVFLPLMVDQEPIGLLKLYYGHWEAFTPARLAWFDELSRLMASAIQNAREHTRVFELATKDGLTNLHNRRYFEEQFYLELARSRRTGSPLCLLMLDIDKFKDYNDRNGHLAGDDVLLTVAGLIKNSIRTVDLIARYGGEEFIMLLTGADRVIGRTVANKIRSAVEKAPIPKEEAQPGGALTVSIGVAELKPTTKRMEDLIRTADKALYQAKDLGRNRVVLAED